MSHEPDWLPALISLGAHGGDWARYLGTVYACFRTDFVASVPVLQSKSIIINSSLVEDGKETTFWHLISETDQESGERFPDMRRCERLAWVRPMIEAVSTGRVLHWTSSRKGQGRFVIALTDFSYVVILAPRRRNFFLLTAFFVEREHRREKLKREFETNRAIKKDSAAP